MALASVAASPILPSSFLDSKSLAASGYTRRYVSYRETSVGRRIWSGGAARGHQPELALRCREETSSLMLGTASTSVRRDQLTVGLIG